MSGHYSDLVDHMVRDHAYHSHSHADMFALAKRYGFVPHGDECGKSNNKHIRYTHRDYPDLYFNLPFGKGEVPAVYAEDIAKLCLEVRKRNAARRDNASDPIPQWVLDALPDGTCVRNVNKTVTFETKSSGGNLEQDTVSHSYILQLKGKSLTIQSIDYPAYHSHFTLSDSMHHREQALQRFVLDIDEKVVDHISDVALKFNAQLLRLKTECGFETQVLPNKRKGAVGGLLYVPLPQGDARTMHLHHPMCHLDYFIEQPKEGEIIPDTALQVLTKIASDYDAKVYAQLELLQKLNQQGWETTQTYQCDPSDLPGRTGNLTFTLHSETHPDEHGVSFSVPTYGIFDMFDTVMVNNRIASLCTPSPVVSSAEHQGCGAPQQLPFVDQIDMPMQMRSHLPVERR